MTDVRIQIEHGWFRAEIHEDRPPRIMVGAPPGPDQLTAALVSAVDRVCLAAHIDPAEVALALSEIAHDRETDRTSMDASTGDDRG